MSGYQFVLFDLDGTLTDSKLGITRSVRYALNKLGLSAEAEDLTPFVGPPLHESFRRFYSFDEKQVRQAVEFYREYYAGRGIFENNVYTGIPELLRDLQDTGKVISLATSKPTFYAEKILRHFRLENNFTLIVGSNMDGTRADKAEIVGHVLTRLPFEAHAEAVMVGDRLHDIAGARAHGLDSIAVTYGYGTLEELTRADPTCLVHSVDELKSLLGA